MNDSNEVKNTILNGDKKKEENKRERNDDSSRSSARITGRKNLINKSFFYQGEYMKSRF